MKYEVKTYETVGVYKTFVVEAESIDDAESKVIDEGYDENGRDIILKGERYDTTFREVEEIGEIEAPETETQQ